MLNIFSSHKTPRVKITLFRFAGKWWPFRVRQSCPECDLTYVVLQRLMAQTFMAKPVDLEIVPWLDNWWRPILRGGWRAPIVTVNGRVFSQGQVPDIRKLVQTIAAQLGDESLAQEAATLSPYHTPPAASETLPALYFSPACPHCRLLKSYLDANHVAYVGHDVSQSETAREQVKKLTGHLTIPVLQIGETILTGFNRARLQKQFNIAANKDQWQETPGRIRNPQISPELLSEIVVDAQSVLESNWIDNRPVPSKALYPHQWNWDTGFIARGYLHIQPERAYHALRTLFQAQWKDGFLPHIVFNPDAPDHFPGPQYWHSEYSKHAPRDIFTSSISQPPVHASMIADACELDRDTDRAKCFLLEMYPRLKSLHDFYFNNRDPHGENLICIVHPWESGIDNAPIWDRALSRITPISPWAAQMQQQYNQLAQQEKRPQRSYIGTYSHLVENLFNKKHNWSEITRDHDFLVQDVLFNSILCKAERDLAEIAEILGIDSQPHNERARALSRAINDKLWDPQAGLYYDYDLVAQAPIKRDTIFSYFPLAAGICSRERAGTLLDSLRSHCFCLADRNCVGIPSYDMCKTDYQGEYYWRGPVWVNINWYLAQGMRQYGEEELADWIETSLLHLVKANGFYEYYEPETGKGLGAPEFSWTAALAIDIARRHLNPKYGIPDDN